MAVTKTAMVSMVGRPNVGKSTLTNALVGKKIAIVSRKPQTTRTRITGVLTKDDCQFILLDTPGFHKPQNRLGDYMVKVVRDTVSSVDAAVLIVEPFANIGIPEQQLIEKLRADDIPALLVINKIDLVPKETLLEVIAAYEDAYPFDAIIPVSAKTRDGLSALLQELSQYAVPGPALFPEDMISDQPEIKLLSEIVREKLLRLLDKEVPHGTAVEITRFAERKNGIVDVDATIYCERESHKGIIIGRRGAMLKEVGELARRDMERFLDAKVCLKLWVKVKEGWRDNLYQMRSFGFADEE